MFLLYKAKISGERLQDHWSSGFFFFFSFSNVISHYVIICMHIWFLLICYVCNLSMKIKLS